MNTLILTMLIQTWCNGYMKAEYNITIDNRAPHQSIAKMFPDGPRSSHGDILDDYHSCIDSEDAAGYVFSPVWIISDQDIRIAR